MEKLLEAISIAASEAQKLNTALQNAVNYANNITTEADIKLKSASDKEAANIAASADLAVRDAKVKNIEDIVSLKEQASELIRKAKESEIVLEKSQVAFKEACKIEYAKILKEKQKNIEDAEMVKKEFAALKKEQEKLVLDKQDMVNKIIANLSKK